jgi:hypothetical protein
MSTRALTAALLLACPLATLASPLSEQLADLDARLAAVASHGPNFPEALDLHRLKALAYARAFQEDCRAHQALAATEAAVYLDNPHSALLPSFASHRYSLTATLAWGRGQCSETEDELVQETEAARQDALRALEAAVQSHSYDDEAFVRFQIANYSRILADTDASIAMLESAIALDDAHGLADDGEENRNFLADWKQVDRATLPAAPKPPSFTLNFGWHPTHIDIDTTFVKTRYSSSAPVTHTFDASASGELQARTGGGFFVKLGDVSLQSRTAYSEQDSEARMARVIQEAVAKQPVVEVDRDGNFLGLADFDAYQKGLRDSVLSMYPADSPDHARAQAAIDNYITERVSKRSLENDAGRSHALNTAIWVGSTLETGKTMTLDLNLPLDGVPSVVVLHHLEFRLDGAAPCQANDTSAPHCVEIEMEATPTSEAIDGIAATLIKQGKGHLHYWSSLKNRIVVDPKTLLSYQQDTRRAHYLQLEKSDVESEVTQSLDRVNYHN